MAPSFATWKGQKTGKASRVFRYKTAASAARTMKFNDKRAIVAVARSVARASANSKDKKYVQINTITANIDTTGLIQDVSIVPLGMSVVTRIGKQISLKSFQIRGTIKAQTASATHGTMMLVYDREPNAAAALPVMTDILQLSTSNSLTNRDNAPRFKIVRHWDWSIVGTSGVASAPDSSVYCVNEFVRFKAGKYPIKWTAADTNGLYTTKIKGALLLVFVGDVAAGTSAPTFAGNARLDFDDL